MRKIKITALLLAVLMIVTAFAGCASKSTVTNLDNKVNDLDASIEEQKAALSGIESTLATISKALENQGSSENLDEVIKDIEENEKATADLAGAIKDLQSAIEDLKKEPATQAPATEDVKVAASQYSAKLEAFEGSIDDDKANYTVESLAAIRDIIGKAEATIANSATADDAKKAYEDAVAAVAGYPSVNYKLYTYVVELKGNITDESAAKVAEAAEALKEAIKFYEKNGDKLGAKSEALTAYEVSATEDVDLVDEINKLIKNQEVDLVDVKTRAADLTKEIAAIKASYSFDRVSEIFVKYKVWAKDATELSPKNVALVGNYDKLVASQESALNTHAAMKYLSEAKIFTMIHDTTTGSTLPVYGTKISIFDDYKALQGLRTNGQVIFTYPTKDTNGKAVLGLTSEIYAAIDAEIAKWQSDYKLVDEAVEYVINALQGDDFFYAKYKADRALVNAMEDEYEKFVAVDGVFTAIKALNDKRLDANAVEVALAFEKNAWDIENWQEAQKKAYKAEITATADRREKNVDTPDKFAAVLLANFNAMVEYAKLCQFNGDIKNPQYGVKGFVEATGTDEKLDLNNDKIFDDKDYYKDIYGVVQSGKYVKEFTYNTKYDVANYSGASDFMTLNDTNPRTFYFELYDFSNEALVEFLLVDYKNAKAAANAINKMIENFVPAQAISVRSIVEGIGGYAKLNATGDKILALEDADIKAYFTVPAGTAVPAPKTIAQFDYFYNKSRVYDLTALLKLDLYEEKLALAESHIAAADKMAAELNAAYSALVGNKPTVLVTMNNVAAIADVYNLFAKKYLNQVREDMMVAKVINTTGAGVKEYEIKKILDPYTAINEKVPTTTIYKVLDNTNGMIVKLAERALYLKAEANLVLSAYQMLDKMNGYSTSSFGLTPMSNNGYIGNMTTGTSNNTYLFGIVSLDVSPDAMTEAGVDAAGLAYQKGQYKWTVEYVTFDHDGKDNKAVFKTAKHIGYYFGNDKAKIFDAVTKEIKSDGTPDTNKSLAKYLKTLVWSTTGVGTAITTNAAISTEVLDNISAFVDANDIAKLSTKTTTLYGDTPVMIPSYALAALALELDARFQLDNYGEYAPIVEARKNFDPANGGYGFNFIKGITLMKLIAKDSTLPTIFKTSVLEATTVEELRVAVNTAVDAIAGDDRLTSSQYIDLDIVFGAASNIDEMFDIEFTPGFVPYEAGSNYLRDFGLDRNDFKVPGIVIYKRCTHTGLTGTCIHSAGVCPDCGETISATSTPVFKVESVNVKVPFDGTAKDVELVVGCNVTSCNVEEKVTIASGASNPLNIIKDAANTGKTVEANDKVVIKLTYLGVDYTLESVFDGTKWANATVVSAP